MRTKTIIPITEARKNIFSLVEKAQNSGECYTLTERGRAKAVLMSAEKFESLTQKKKGFLAADGSREEYGRGGNVYHFPHVMVIRDASKIVYLKDDDRELKYKEESLIKSQPYVMLVERYKYPLDRIEIGRYVKVGGKDSRRYIEADILVNDFRGDVRMIFEAGTFSDYEERKDGSMADLFELARAVTWAKKPDFLVYFSRAVKNGEAREKVFVVDYKKFNTFVAWKRAGRPGETEIPGFLEG